MTQPTARTVGVSANDGYVNILLCICNYLVSPLFLKQSHVTSEKQWLIDKSSYDALAKATP